eukprot:8343819-Pyramimonas_sp.AAC.2
MAPTRPKRAPRRAHEGHATNPTGRQGSTTLVHFPIAGYTTPPCARAAGDPATARVTRPTLGAR